MIGILDNSLQEGNPHRPVHSLHLQPPQQGQAGSHQMLAVESDKDLGNRGPGSRGGPPKGDFPEEWLPREVHRKCNDAENHPTIILALCPLVKMSPWVIYIGY